MAQKIILSARFKRDYVAASAIVIFLLIVLSEISLAVAIPLYLHREDTMAREVRRLRLLETFDGARNQATFVKPRNETAAAEARLIGWNLDLLAPYLRSYTEELSDKEIAELQKAVNEMSATLRSITGGRVFSVENNLDSSIYLDTLINRLKKKKTK